jgi:hypothetical protein
MSMRAVDELGRNTQGDVMSPFLSGNAFFPNFLPDTDLKPGEIPGF